MKRQNKIIYRVATGWLALGMISTGIVQLIQMKAEVDKTCLTLGYPAYFLTILGTWKILGAVAILVPKYPLLKEWAYSGFFFAMTGAIFSHLAVGDHASTFFGPTLLLILTMVSWYTRPSEKTLKTFKPRTYDESASGLVLQ